MDSGWYVWFPIIVFFLLYFISKKKKKKNVAIKYLQGKKERKIMQELAKRFIGKDCYINLLDGTADGILTEVTDHGIVLEKDGKQQIINLDYVVKLREYPYNKNGKRASVFGE